MQVARLDVVFCDALLLAAEGHAERARYRLAWYLAQPHLEPLDRSEAEATRARLGRAAQNTHAAQTVGLQTLLDEIATPHDGGDARAKGV